MDSTTTNTAPIVSWKEFNDGFWAGWSCFGEELWAFPDELERTKETTFGKTSQKRVPTDYGRGFARGYRFGIAYTHEEVAPSVDWSAFELEAYHKECRRKLRLEGLAKLQALKEQDEAKDRITTA
jgi:hypothetical protein